MKDHKIYFLDAIFVLLNISSPYTIIPNILFTKQTGANSAIIFVLTLIYTFFRFGNRIKYPADKLLGVFLFLNIYNLINAYSQDTFAIGFLATLLANTAFYFYLYNLYCDYRRYCSLEDALKLLMRGYIWLCIYQLFIVAGMVLLSESHIISPHINNISYSYDIFQENVSRGTTYFFPYNISVLLYAPYDRLPFLQTYGIFTGMFHEPHTMTYYVVPFLFLMQVFYSKKKLITLDALFFIYMLVAASVTNILCVFATLIFWLSLINKKLAVFSLLLVYGGFMMVWHTDNPVVEYVQFKLDGSSSMTYSETTLDFAFQPKTLFGTNFYDKDYIKNVSASYDVGYIVFFLNILFLAILIFKTLILCFSSKKVFMYAGLFSIYFIMHSTKLALRTYSLEMLMMVIFLVNICYKEKGGLRSVIKSSARFFKTPNNE